MDLGSGATSITADNEASSLDELALQSAILRESDDVVLVRDEHHEYIYVSPAAERVFGLTIDDLRSAGDELFHDDDRGVVARLSRKVRAEEGLTMRARVRLLLPGGDPRWVDLVATNLLHDSDIRGLVINLRDAHGEVEAESRLRLAERRYQTLVEHARDVVLVIDSDLRVTYATPSIEEAFGYTPDEVLGTNGSRLVHPQDLEMASQRLNGLLEGGEVERATVRVLRKFGGWAWVEIIGVDMRSRPEVDGIVLNLRDVTDRIRSEQGSERLTSVLGAASDIVTIVDREFRLLYANDAALSLFGLTSEAMLGQIDSRSLIPPQTIERFAEQVVPALRSAGAWTGELEFETVAGETIPMWSTQLAHRDDSGRTQFISGISRDMRERKAFEARLEHQANHDALTGLPNREAMVRAIDETLQTDGQRHAVFFLDLDEFKIVNDTLGHEHGDELLRQVAARLEQVVRPEDLVARFGGDEFVVLCRELASHGDALAVAERIVRGLDDRYFLGEHEARTSASVGIAFVGAVDDENASSLLRDADMAMYAAKDDGRSRYAVFDSSLRAETIGRHQTESALRVAVERGELFLEYQPIVSLSTGLISGYEALVRWHHPERGRLAPDEFISLAEERGLIVTIGHWVIDRALRDLRQWNHGAARPVRCSINVSGRQMRDPSLVASLDDALARTGLDASLLTLELTESVVMDDVAATIERLGSLKELGLRLAVDDFGTGYSSLAYLRRFPVDEIKIDRAFVSGIETDPENVEIVTAITRLAHSLRLDAVGEGVETASQLRELERVGCDLAQGYFLGRPVSAEAVAEDLSTSATPADPPDRSGSQPRRKNRA